MPSQLWRDLKMERNKRYHMTNSAKATCGVWSTTNKMDERNAEFKRFKLR